MVTAKCMEHWLKKTNFFSATLCWCAKECPARMHSVTNASLLPLQVTGHAQKRAGDLQDQAADTVEGAKATATDALNKGQAHGESAWQKAKDAVTNAYEQVGWLLFKQTCYQLQLRLLWWALCGQCLVYHSVLLHAWACAGSLLVYSSVHGVGWMNQHIASVRMLSG